MSNKRHLYRAFSGIPQQGVQNQKSLHKPCLLRVPMLGKDRYHSLPSWGPHSGEGPTWLHHPCLLGVPWWGLINMATSPLSSRGSPIGGTKSGSTNPSWELGKMSKKNSILSINTWGDLFSSPFKRGTKIFRRVWRQPISPDWLVLWSGTFKHLRPLEGVVGWGGRLGSGTAPGRPPCPTHSCYLGHQRPPRCPLAAQWYAGGIQLHGQGGACEGPLSRAGVWMTHSSRALHKAMAARGGLCQWCS